MFALSAYLHLFGIDWNDDDGDFFVAKDDMEQIRRIRLHDLVDKLRYDQLARRVGDALRDEMFRVEYGGEFLLPRNVKSLRENAPEAKVFVGSAMTRSTGICDLKYVVAVDGDTPVMLGVQLQANALKLFLEMDDKAKAKKTADALWKPNGGKKIWYNFAGMDGSSEEFPKKQGQNL